MRLPSLIAVSGLLLAGVGFFGKPLSERLADKDVSALMDKAQDQINDARQASIRTARRWRRRVPASPA